MSQWILDLILIHPSEADVERALRDCRDRLSLARMPHYDPLLRAGVSLLRPPQRHRRGSWQPTSVLIPGDFPFAIAWCTTSEELRLVRLTGVAHNKEPLRRHGAFQHRIQLWPATHWRRTVRPSLPAAPSLAWLCTRSPQLLQTCLASPVLAPSLKVMLALACTDHDPPASG